MLATSSMQLSLKGSKTKISIFVPVVGNAHTWCDFHLLSQYHLLTNIWGWEVRLTFNSAAYELAPEHCSSNPASLHCPALCTYVHVHMYPPTHISKTHLYFKIFSIFLMFNGGQYQFPSFYFYILILFTLWEFHIHIQCIMTIKIHSIVLSKVKSQTRVPRLVPAIPTHTLNSII